GVGRRLAARAPALLDRARRLGEKIDQLQARRARERLAHDRDRLEQRALSVGSFHPLLFKRSLDSLSSADPPDLEVCACTSDSCPTTRPPARPTFWAARPTASSRSWIPTSTWSTSTSPWPTAKAFRSWPCWRRTCRPTMSQAYRS